MVAPECAPVAKAGGLGDVVFGLSRELEIRGHAVEIVLPKYACMRHEDVWDLQPCYENLWVPWYGEALHCTVYFGYVHGRKCFFIEPHPEAEFFGRNRLYGHHDDVMRFTAFSKAALEFLVQTNKRPDVIHCHDWQTGLVPVLLNDQFRPALPTSKVCYTIHNFRHQGHAESDVLWSTNLGHPEHYLHHDRLGDDHRYGVLNLMKGGIVYADYVTTVSPNHAGEARYGDGAFGLGQTLHVHQHKFHGILNGVDYDVWNPEVDSHIPVQYSATELIGKYQVKERLRERFWLRRSWSPSSLTSGGWTNRRACSWSTTRSSTRSPREPSSSCWGSRCMKTGSAATSDTSSTI